MLAVLVLVGFSWWESSPAAVMRGDVSPLSIVVRVIPMIAIACALLLWDFKRNFSALSELRRTPLLAVLFLYGVVALAVGFAQAGSLVSGWKGMEILVLAYFGAHVASARIRSDEAARLLRTYFWTLGVLLLWTTVVALARPDTGFRPLPIPQIQGVIPHLNPNTLGFLSVSCLVFFLVVRAHWFVKAFMVMLSAAICFSAQSRSVFILVLFLLILQAANLAVNLVRRQRSGSFRRNLPLFAGILLFLALFAAVGRWVMPLGGGYFQRGTSVESLRSLSGRDDLWAVAVAEWKQSPLVGYGIGVASRTMTVDNPLFRATFQEGGVGSAHNSVLEALLGGGAIGAGLYLVLFYAMVTRAWTGAIAQQRTPTLLTPAMMPLILVTVLFFRSLSSATMAVFSADTLLLVTLTAGRFFPWQRAYVAAQVDDLPEGSIATRRFNRFQAASTRRLTRAWSTDRFSQR